MFELLREVELHRDATRRALGELGERQLEARVAVAKEDVLRIEGEVAWIAEDEVEPLLGDEPRGECEDRRLPPAQPHRTLEREAVALLAAQVFRRIPTRDDRVARGIPDLLIDSVDDADETVAQRDEHAVQPEAALLRTQLVRMCRAHRHDE